MDIALVMNNDNLTADMVVSSGQPVIDNGLQTAVYMSLFSDARVGDVGGWWGDILEPEDAPEALGSRLWTLAREKILPGIEQTIEGYCQEALKWMLDSNIAAQIVVDATIISRQNVLIDIQIFQPSGLTTEYRFNWDAQAAQTIAAAVDEINEPSISAIEYDGTYFYDGYVTAGRIS